VSSDETIDLGERVTELRTRRGLSQRDLAAEVGRSESWVSQVERGVLRVDRLPVLQALADALGVAVRDLRPDSSVTARAVEGGEGPSDLDELRLTVTGHPAPGLLLAQPGSTKVDVDGLALRVAEAWSLTHASAFREVSSHLTQLLPELEQALRGVRTADRAKVARLLADAYQAAASAFARLDEADAALVAADRSISVAESGGDRLGALSGLFRISHAFITLRRLDQAEHAAATGLAALADVVQRDEATPEQLSVYGALQLVTAIVHARGGQRVKARQALDDARTIAKRLGEDRNDYETEFAPQTLNSTPSPSASS
jgi:transcriptional regulator with XRE-family HTH domain